MPSEQIFNEGTQGVSMRSKALLLGRREFASATNIQFEENSIKTRHGFLYQNTGIKGRFQGATTYLPDQGISSQKLGPNSEIIAVAAGGKLHAIHTKCRLICSTSEILKASFPENEDVDLYQAESLLIAGGRSSDTFWWNGNVDDKACRSKGPSGKDKGDDPSHDRLEDFEEFLLNGVPLGTYAHGRIHQFQDKIYVSDIIHKRQEGVWDITLMEEQFAGSYGDPISVSTRTGKLRAWALWQRPGTQNGEGVLVAYFDCAILFIGTDEAPRETRTNPETGEIIQRGWELISLTQHRLNTISAVGRYAVAQMPHDHAFRSPFGIHFLTFSLGEGTIKDESNNITSTKVDPLFDCDDRRDLDGSAVGHSIELSRLFATVGMMRNKEISTSSYGRGFASWHQSMSFTEDRTPVSGWEGLWSPDHGIEGIHRFIQRKDDYQSYDFGFISSREDGTIDYATIEEGQLTDIRDDVSIPIEWQVETGQYALSSLRSLDEVTGGRLEVTVASNDTKIRVLVRTDRNTEYELWKEVEPCNETLEFDQMLRNEVDLGLPPKAMRESSWIQIRVEGIGYAELHEMTVEWATKEKDKKTRCLVVRKIKQLYHYINNSTPEERWK